MHIASRLCSIRLFLLFKFNIVGKMYRPLAVSVIFLGLVGCGSGTKAASAANSSDTLNQSAQGAAAQQSDTAGGTAGPNSTTQASGTSYATNPANGSGAGGSNAGPSNGGVPKPGAPLPGKPNPNRVPNEM